MNIQRMWWLLLSDADWCLNFGEIILRDPGHCVVWLIPYYAYTYTFQTAV